MGVSPATSGFQGLRTQAIASPLLNHSQLIPLYLVSSAFPHHSTRQLYQCRSFFFQPRRRHSDRERYDDPLSLKDIQRFNRRYFWRYDHPFRRAHLWHHYCHQPGGGRGGPPFWGCRRSKSGSSRWGRKNDDLSYWEEQAEAWQKEFQAEQERIEKEFAEFKKEMDNDPYGVVFGRRLQPFPFGLKEGSWSSFCRSLFATSASANPSAANSKPVINVKKAEAPEKNEGTQDTPEGKPSSSNDITFEFDPVTGRMVPKDASTDSSGSTSAAKSGGKKATSPRSGDRDSDDIDWRRTPSSEAKNEPSGISLDDGGFSKAAKQPQDHGNNAKVSGSQNQDKESVILMGEPSQSTVKPKPEPTSATGAGQTDTRKKSIPVKKSYDKGQPASRQQHESTTGRKTETRLEDHSPGLANLNVSKPEPTEKGDVAEASSMAATSDDYMSFDQPFQPGVSNNPTNAEEEDLDLLRPSDIRVPFARRKTKQDIEDEKSQSRSALAKDYNNNKQSEETEIDVEVLRGRKHISAIPQKDAAIKDLNVLTSELIYPGSSVYSQAVSTDQNKSATDQNANASKGNKGETRSSLEGRSDLEELEDQICGIYETTYGPIAPEPLQKQINQGIIAGMKDKPVATAERKASKNASSEHEAAMAAARASSEREDKMKDILSRAENVVDSVNPLMAELNKILEKVERRAEFHANNGYYDMGPSIKTPSSAKTSADNTSAEYRILTYDSSTGRLRHATISAMQQDNMTRMHPAEVLSSLDNASPFMDYLVQFEKDGYQIVSGGRNLVVFRKVRPDGAGAKQVDDNVETTASTSSVHSRAEAAQLEREAIADAEQPEQVKSQSPSTSPKVRRQEPVFSGSSPKWNPSESSFDPTSSSSSTGKEKPRPSFLRKTFRRIILTGGITAGCCYAVGVVAEYFRTGGKDGEGPKGFTGLEGR